MTTLQAKSAHTPSAAERELHASVGRSVKRGRFITSLGYAILSLAAVAFAFFIVAIVDIAEPMSGMQRFVLMALILLAGTGVGLFYMVRPWLSSRMQMGAAEQIDRAAQAPDQPVVRGLTLMASPNDDALAQGLRERAEQKAAEHARAVKPQRAYPLSRVQDQTGVLAIACVAWSLFAAMFPTQFSGMVTRVLTPWQDAPPFSLTQLEPTWEPEPPDHGDNVLVSVVPEGRLAERVAFLVMDEEGNEAERFEMVADEQGGFTHLLRRVEEPITFKLEAYGRATQPYTITPNPPPTAEQPDSASDNANTGQGDTNADSTDPGGTTTGSADAGDTSTQPTHPDWAQLKEEIERLMQQLADAQAQAQSLDPSDLAAAQALADQLAELLQEAGELSEKLDKIRGELPPDAAASLQALADALAQMHSGTLPGPPSGGSPANGTPTPQQANENAQWLDQAANAAEQDQQSLAQGLGQSDLPTDSGTTSGDNGDAPEIRDPAATGGYDEQSGSGDTGPLPDAVMQQVPPSYRDHINAYFTRLAEPEDENEQ